MEEIFIYIQDNVAYAPFIIFGLLLLAGLNIPISEDAMLFISALLAVKHPEQLSFLFCGVFLGAYGSDLISYGLGRFLGQRLWKIKFFQRMVSAEKVSRLGHFYQKNGLLTLVFGRFIPFGVRNALFITAGISKMNFWRFALYDLAAATLSCSCYFYLYYRFGPSIVDTIKRGNIILFAIFLMAALVYFYYKKKKALTKH